MENNLSYICAEILATSLKLSEAISEGQVIEIEETKIFTLIKKEKHGRI